MDMFGGGLYKFRASNCTEVMDAETFLEDLPDFTARQTIEGALAILEPKLVTAPMPLVEHEPAALVQLIVAMTNCQMLSFGQKKTSNSQSVSTTVKSDVTVAAPGESPQGFSTSAPPVESEVATSADNSACGSLTDALAESSAEPKPDSSRSPNTGDGECSPEPEDS